MGKSKEANYNSQATAANQQVLNTANQISTPYSDKMRPLAQERVEGILSGKDNSEVLKGLMPVSEEELLAQRDLKRGADGNFALAAPDANANYTMDRREETNTALASNRARGMGDARKQALEYFNNMGFASEGRGIDAMAMKGSLQNSATGNYLQQQNLKQTRKTGFDKFLQFSQAAMSGASMFA